jgi:hypothetical protein
VKENKKNLSNYKIDSGVHSRAKITIFISLASYLRNWIGADAFKKLEEMHDVTYLIPEYDWNPHDIRHFTNAKYLVIKQPKWRMEIYRRFLQISMLAASDRSEAFRIKLTYANQNFINFFVIFKYKIFFNIFRNIFNSFMPKWSQLSEYLSENQPDLLIAPSLLADTFTIDLSHATRKFGVKTILLVNSWDNLISKGTMPFEPDLLVVWGANSIKHAEYVQRINSKKIAVLGVPRFESYFGKQTQDTLISYNRKYICDYNSISIDKKIILYPATSLPFDDMSALQLIDIEISKNKKLENFVVLYRPHPETIPRVDEKFFFDQNFENVLMDKQMISYYRSRFGGARGQDISSAINNTDLSYYPKLLNSIEAVVSPATTMVLEALILGKPIVMICYDDGVNKRLPPSEVARYENVRELMELPGVYSCREETSLIPMLHEALDISLSFGASQKISNSTSGIVYRDATPYSSRLLSLVNSTLT